MKSIWRAAVPVLACLALSGCLLQPGNFASTLDLRKDGSFTFSYKGQIFMLALSKLANQAMKSDEVGEFVQQPCQGDDLKERPCTAAEIAEQKRKWEEDKQTKLEQDKQNKEALRAMMGGADPNDPKAGQALAEELKRQAGWRQVTYSGDGLFEVDFQITSKLTHDFAFPTLETLPMDDYFVLVARRQDGTARINAPGFSAQGAGNPLTAMMAGLATMGTADAANKGKGTKPETAPPVPQLDGTFRIVTDGQILANNTDEGPRAGAGGQILQWTVNQRTQAAPTALVKLVP